MTTFTGAQGQAAIDNLGFVANAIKTQLGNISTSAIATNLATEITRIQALTDALVNPVLGSGWEIEQSTATQGGLPAGKTLSWMAGLVYSALVNQYPMTEACDRLDYICSQISNYTGLADFLVGNAVLIDQYSADMFNGWVALVNAGGLPRKWGTLTPKLVPSTSIFPHSNVDTLNTWTATGATTGTLAAGSQTLAGAIITGGNSTPGGGVVEGYAGNGIGAGSYTLTVTYVKIDGTTGQTFTLAVVGNATNNTIFTPTPNPGPNLASITSIAVTTGSANVGDVIKFRLKPVRAITA